mmetsp:Transcript_11011/g.27292  ORF Transcript_11011/g.27292 Transcript_11011/m.27292 type:complete len:253 (-) Transcript_11011:328-1086(-)
MTPLEGPWYTKLPSESSVRVSNISKILKRGWWIERTMVRPCRARRFRSARTWLEVVASRPVVGSSRKSTEGDVMSSMPMLTRLRSPPLMPRINSLPTLLSATFPRPSSSMTFCTRFCFSEYEMVPGKRSSALNIRFSLTVSVPMTMSSCTTYPELCLKFSESLGAPSTRMVPLTLPASLRSASTSSRDVLPPPEEPMMALSVPGWMLPVQLVRMLRSTTCFVSGSLTLTVYVTLWKPIELPSVKPMPEAPAT